jgi:hypothetical protein
MTDGKRTRRRWLATGAAAIVIATALAGWAVHAHGGPGGPPQKDMTIDAAVRRDVIAAICDNMERHYVFPDQARRLSVELEARAARGDFDRVTSADKFADTMTETLQAVLKDKHLEVRYFADAVAPDAGGAEPTPAEVEAERVEHARFNHGVAEFKRLQGNIGYLDLHSFGRPDATTPRYAAVMALMKDTAAMVIDLRRTGGGDPDSVMLLASYLFDQRTHLNDIWMREDKAITERWTDPAVAGPRYGQSRPIVLLVGPDTFSAGEDFAYALKNAHRATLVGETTGGGAHPGQPRRLTDHFMMNVPAGRSISPVTHTDWEGTGVAPDIRIDPDKALDRAQLVLLEKLVPAEKDPDWKRRITERLDELR